MGKTYQKEVMRLSYNTELIKKATGDISFRKNNAAEMIAKTFTSIIITLISRLLIK